MNVGDNGPGFVVVAPAVMLNAAAEIVEKESFGEVDVFDEGGLFFRREEVAVEDEARDISHAFEGGLADDGVVREH